MITKSNYKSSLSQIDTSAMPEMLQDGHEFFLESVEFYDEDKDIKETLDLYLTRLNEYLSFRKGSKEFIIRDFYAQLTKTDIAKLYQEGFSSAKQKLATTLNITLNEVLDFADTLQSKSKRTSANPEASRPKPEKQQGNVKLVEQLHEEVKFIKRFIGFHNKAKQASSILSYIKSLQKAIVNKLIRKSSAYAADIRTIQDKLVKLYNQSDPDGEMKLVINEKDLTKYISIVGGEAVYKSIEIIRRFVGMQGKELEASKIEAFIKYVNKAAITSEDPYFDRVQAIVDQVKKYKQGKLKVADQELSGLRGILKGCNCHLGKLYDTGNKPLRRCRSKKYSDAGRGACSHHQGVKKEKYKELNGIMTAEEVAKMHYDKLLLTGKWKELIGQPAANFDMMVFGPPGSGKTTFLLSFAHYLSTNFGDTLYVSKEEFNSSTLTDKVNQLLTSFPPNLHFVKDFRNIPFERYKFVILDSITDLGLDLKTYKELREQYPNTAFILILQITKAGQFRGGKDWEHEVEVAGEINNGVINIYRNRYGVRGNLNFFEN